MRSDLYGRGQTDNDVPDDRQFFYGLSIAPAADMNAVLNAIHLRHSPAVKALAWLAIECVHHALVRSAMPQRNYPRAADVDDPRELLRKKLFQGDVQLTLIRTEQQGNSVWPEQDVAVVSHAPGLPKTAQPRAAS